MTCLKMWGATLAAMLVGVVIFFILQFALGLFLKPNTANHIAAPVAALSCYALYAFWILRILKSRK